MEAAVGETGAWAELEHQHAVAVCDTSVARLVAEVPEFLHDVLGGHGRRVTDQ